MNVLPITRAVTGLTDLVRAAQGGNRSAFGELYARYLRMVHGILVTRVPRDHVDDLVQDVFMSALQRLTSLRDPRAFGAWLGTIARNEATDHLRRAPRTAELTAEVIERMVDPRTQHPAGHADALAVLGIIRGLPDAYRDTLVLRLVEGMTGPEIAERTGLSEGSVRVNLHRGMKHLRERLAASTLESVPGPAGDV